MALRPSTEQEISTRLGDAWCASSTFELSSGVRLNLTRCRYESFSAFPALQPAAEIELAVSVGSPLLTRTAEGQELIRGGHTLQIGRTRRQVPLTVRPLGESPTECMSLTLTETRLRELLGTRALPASFRAVTESCDAHPLISRPLSPRLFRILEEMLGSNPRGPGRSLWYEAKALELLALVADDLAGPLGPHTPRLPTREADSLERVRTVLLANLQSRPTLRDLSRVAGLSETKLKSGFRAHFDTSIFAFLRSARLQQARRLIAEHGLNVTEAAQRVGYANPSKFAAAFRRHFGVEPKRSKGVRVTEPAR